MLKIFTDFFYNTPIIDIIAVITGIIYVLLAAKNHILCWLFGIISSALTTYAVFFHYNLYMETFLNAFYVFAGVWGWLNWNRQKKLNRKVISYGWDRHLPIILSGLAFTFILGFIFKTWTDSSAPYLDAFTTVFALMTTFMVGLRILENWLYWIVIDSASIYLYSSRGGHFFILLFSVYIIVSVLGYLQWRKEYKTDVQIS